MDRRRVNDAVQQLQGVAASTRFSGVVRIDVGDEPVHVSAHGLADRAHDIAMQVGTRIGTASVAKGFTALTVMALVERGTLALDTRARDLLGADLPLVDDGVTVEQLLAHRSGIGDYLDEDAVSSVSDHVLAVPVHLLATMEDYLQVLDGHPQVAPPGERFAYCNSGFVLLAVLAERAAGVHYHDLVDELVTRPAGLTATGFPRTDSLPGDVAIGYLDEDGLRSNVLHLPVRGGGDGGVVTTVDDLAALWTAVADGRVVQPGTWAAMTTRRSTPDQHSNDYGLGVWLSRTSDGVHFEGYDAGASARTYWRASDRLRWSVLANTSEGAWPLVRTLRDALGG